MNARWQCILPILLALLGCLAPAARAHAQSRTDTIEHVVNRYAAVTEISDCSTIFVDNPTQFSVNDRVLIIQMKGLTIGLDNSANFGAITSYGSSGNFEFGTIALIIGNQIALQSQLQKLYDISGLVQLVGIPHYQNAYARDRLSATPWNGRTGGVVAIDCLGTLYLPASSTGGISASGLGFSGGKVSEVVTARTRTDFFYAGGSGDGGYKGEGAAAIDNAHACGRGAPANGGGGGNNHNAGGGGGGSCGAGGIGGKQYSGFGQDPLGGAGGRSMPYPDTSFRAWMGGGGGGGHQNELVGTPGGTGGGIVIIRADMIEGSQADISARGSDAGESGFDGAGGGGGGGAVLIQARSVHLRSIDVGGGAGGSVNNGRLSSCHGTGGGGGGGIIWLSAPGLSGGIGQALVNGGAAGSEVNTQSPCHGTSYGAGAGVRGTVRTDLELLEDDGSRSRLTALCSGDSIQLTTAPGVSYAWSPAEGLSCTDCREPVATPSRDITYTVVVRYASGCQDVFTTTLDVISQPVDVSGLFAGICLIDSTKLASATCRLITLRNRGDVRVDLTKIHFLHNVDFSIPPSQLPLSIPPHSDVTLKVCFAPTAEGEMRDTLVAQDGGCPMRVPMVSYGVGFGSMDGLVCNTSVRLGSPGGRPGLRLLAPGSNAIVTSPVTFRFSLAGDARVRLVIHDGLGRVAAMLVDASLSAGVHDVEWDGRGLSSGIYSCTLTAGGEGVTNSLMLVK
ncbi:MAG: hypothetical protein JWQ98_49 [Chlorobi bacterium]|nr:hypothetical protein [Chlorobiota bacterium]